MGTKATIKTIDGKKLEAKIPQGSVDGSMLRFKGYGIPLYGNENVRGDMIGFIKIIMPSKINDEEKNLLEALKKCENFKKNNIENKKNN